MNLLFWTKATKASKLLSKLEAQYHQLQSQPLSEFPEVADLQRESIQIELTKIAHTHYLLRWEHTLSYPFNHPRLPLSPGIVVSYLDELIPYSYSGSYSPPYPLSSNYSNFFQQALANANSVHIANRLASLSSGLSHTFTNPDTLRVADILTNSITSDEYFYRGLLSKADLVVLASHFRTDIVHLI